MTGYVYDAAGRLWRTIEHPETTGYDAAGRIVETTDAPTGGPATSVARTWDGDDRLATVTLNDGFPTDAALTTPVPLDGIDATPTVANPYHCTDNDPLNKTDPTGLRPDDVMISCPPGEAPTQGIYHIASGQNAGGGRGGSGSGLSPNKVNQEISQGRAPRTIKRVDRASPTISGNQDHVHFAGSRLTLNRGGTWHHGGSRSMNRTERAWLRGHGWMV